jgi:AraC-like DNA-binding protein
MTFWKTISVPDGSDGVAPRIQRSIDYMRAHLNRPLQVAELAAQAGCSASHYFTLFKRAVGCPPLDYFTRLRMRHACELLEQGGLSVKAAAARLGYDDPFYFSRVFKATCGVAPRDYRALPAVRSSAWLRPAAPVMAAQSGTSTLAC